NKDLNAQLADLKKTLATTESQITTLQEQIKQLETEKQQLSASNESLSQELGTVRNQLTQTQKRISELETSSSAILLPIYLNEALPVFQKLLGNYINKGVAKLSAEKRGLVITIQNETLYQPGTVILSEEGKYLLAQLVSEINKLPLAEITVEGHTDNLPLKDLPFFDNWALGAARATNIVGYFVELGVKPKLLKAVSASFYHPVASNDTPEGRFKNRRVEIILK
ncbi:MAG: OmpA family protein, partial [Candidatus Sumerlaeia bacterium]|nr:OmpA family protein [Candidatus Sumerlaeia bacterium]